MILYLFIDADYMFFQDKIMFTSFLILQLRAVKHPYYIAPKALYMKVNDRFQNSLNKWWSFFCPTALAFDTMTHLTSLFPSTTNSFFKVCLMKYSVFLIYLYSQHSDSFFYSLCILADTHFEISFFFLQETT